MKRQSSELSVIEEEHINSTLNVGESIGIQRDGTENYKVLNKRIVAKNEVLYDIAYCGN